MHSSKEEKIAKKANRGVVPNRAHFSVMVAVSLCAAFASLGTVSAAPKLKVLPAAVESSWIKTVKLHRTKDGSTVADVLAYAQKMRPTKFKAASFDVGYNGDTGVADSVSIGYWIGAKRAPDDVFVDLGYHMSPSGAVLPVPRDEESARALEGGREAFVRMIDETYRNACHPDPDEDPTC